MGLVLGYGCCGVGVWTCGVWVGCELVAASVYCASLSFVFDVVDFVGDDGFVGGWWISVVGVVGSAWGPRVVGIGFVIRCVIGFWLCFGWWFG